MNDINKIVGQNIQIFLDSRGLNKLWVMERANIEEHIFYNILNGTGKEKIDVHVAKINKLFRIKDPGYCYQTNFNYTKPRNPLKYKEKFFDDVSLSHKGAVSPELKEGFEVFFDFAELIDILKATTS